MIPAAKACFSQSKHIDLHYMSVSLDRLCFPLPLYKYFDISSCSALLVKQVVRSRSIASLRDWNKTTSFTNVNVKMCSRSVVPALGADMQMARQEDWITMCLWGVCVCVYMATACWLCFFCCTAFFFFPFFDDAVVCFLYRSTSSLCELGSAGLTLSPHRPSLCPSVSLSAFELSFIYRAGARHGIWFQTILFRSFVWFWLIFFFDVITGAAYSAELFPTTYFYWRYCHTLT